jgi:PAS domain S-box-containing protein
VDADANARRERPDGQGSADRAWAAAERARSKEQLRRTAETFSTLIEHMPFGVYLVDADFRIVEASQLARRVFALPELIGSDLADALRAIWPEPFASEAIDRFRHAMEAGEPHVSTDTVEQRADRDAVEAYDWRIERVTMPDGRFGVVCYFYDLTDRQRLEEALRRRGEQLRESARQKDVFIATLAHELRNPLAPILNAAEVLQRAESPDGPAGRAADLIVRQAGQMARLLDDLLDMSRIALGRIRLRRAAVDLGSLVHTTVEDLRSTFEADGLEIALHVPSGPVTVSGDPTRLSQMLTNLLTNARKFTDGAGSVTVTVAMADDPTTATIRVADSGIGMRRQTIDRLFVPFNQVDADGTRGGLGLGLAITKGLAELHGGRIRAESEGEGQGSTFTLELPVAAVGAGAAVAREAPPTAQDPALRILLVEDQPDVAEALQLLLEDLGHEVSVALNGADGVALAREQRPAVVLCDVGLPDMDGHAVARDLRADPSTADVYLVALTGFGQRADRDRAQEAGFDEHLTKPIGTSDIEALVQRASRRLHDG